MNGLTKGDSKLNPQIYQVRFKDKELVSFSSFENLDSLGEWISKEGKIWACHSQLDKLEFEKEFFNVTKLKSSDVEIFLGGEGMNWLTPGWRHSVNTKTDYKE